MELLSAHTSRHTQLKELADIVSSYTRLQSEYESQRLVVIEYKQQANYWKAQFTTQKTRETELRCEIQTLKEGLKEEQTKREKELQSEIERLKAALHKREHQLFGKSSEKKKKQDQRGVASEDKLSNAKPRGQQRGSKGHGRRDYDHLEIIEEDLCLADTEAVCPCCGLAYSEFPGTEDSEILEVINVKAYRRQIRRKKYRRNCRCEKNPAPQIITTPTADRLIAKSKIGLSIWAMVLLKKYDYQQPLHRVLKELSSIGLALSPGTIIDGMRKLIPLFAPIYDAIAARSVHANHWHADETRWKVFETSEEKKNHQWYLWIFHNAETVVYKVHPTRSAQVLREYFGENHTGGILNVDRFSAYKVIAKKGLFILAFCWAHVRRDFINYAKGYSDDEAWALSWVEKIGTLYYLNKQRLQHRENSANYIQHDKKLKESLKKYREDIDKQLSDDIIKPEAKKILISLINHWHGLTVFADNPLIPMDNNIAESGLRPPVVGRKNYYGSGAIWAAHLATQLFTLFETLKLHQFNLHTWLLAYLQECAFNQGKIPEHVERFLPWNMNDAQKLLFSMPPSGE